MSPVAAASDLRVDLRVMVGAEVSFSREGVDDGRKYIIMEYEESDADGQTTMRIKPALDVDGVSYTRFRRVDDGPQWRNDAEINDHGNGIWEAIDGEPLSDDGREAGVQGPLFTIDY